MEMILGEVMRVVKRQIHFIIIPMKRVGEPPSDMFDSHAHHILFKREEVENSKN